MAGNYPEVLLGNFAVFKRLEMLKSSPEQWSLAWYEHDNSHYSTINVNVSVVYSGVQNPSDMVCSFGWMSSQRLNKCS